MLGKSVEFYFNIRQFFIFKIWPYIVAPYTILQILGLTFINMAVTTFVLQHLSLEKAIGLISITEEAIRTFSFIIIPWPFLFTLFMSIQEFFLYIYRNPDIVNPQYVTMRSFCILLHFTCYGLQYLGFRKYREEGDGVALTLFIVLAYFVHVIYNTHLAKILMDIVYQV
jgi:hypothetical protein